MSLAELVDGHAVGVEVESGGEVQRVYGRRITLSAGAIASPPILMRSGIGPKADLLALGIEPVVDLPGALVQLRRALKPDGVLLAAMLGGSTLVELRTALFEAELAEEGGVSPRVSPRAQLLRRTVRLSDSALRHPKRRRPG